MVNNQPQYKQNQEKYSVKDDQIARDYNKHALGLLFSRGVK